MIDEEEWREIPEFSNYEINNAARVRNKKLNHILDGAGMVTLTQEGRRRTANVYTLLKEVFPELKDRLR